MNKKNNRKKRSTVTITENLDGTSELRIKGEVAKLLSFASYSLEQRFGREVTPSETLEMLLKEMFSNAETGKVAH